MTTKRYWYVNGIKVGLAVHEVWGEHLSTSLKETMDNDIGEGNISKDEAWSRYVQIMDKRNKGRDICWMCHYRHDPDSRYKDGWPQCTLSLRRGRAMYLIK